MKKNSMYLYGKNSVVERLKANPESISTIFLEENFSDPHILGLIKSRQIPIERVGERRLFGIKNAERLQGIVAEIEPFVYTALEELLERPQGKQLSLLFLDNLNDPHNLGSIMRSAACFGGFGLVIPKHSSCEVNETVIHVSSGAENFVPVALVANLSTGLIQAKKSGYWSVGALVGEGEDIQKVSLPFPLCLVVGSEGKGIREGLEKQIEIKVKIPMAGVGLSFNVAMASAIFCYEITRQRKK